MNDTPLWTLDALAAAVRGRVCRTPAQAITGISIDSRTLGKGEAFFAIKGDRVDGHDYVAKAHAAGAGVSVVAEARLGDMPEDAPLVIVDDVLEALRRLARAARARSKASIVAVTGSVGKTSSKEMLRLALSQSGETHASAASYNNHWGVPLSLARLPQSARYGVFELGMNHAGELTPLSNMVQPHIALITTVEPVHIEFFSGIEAIADAKAEIFAGLVGGGAAVLNRDNAQYDRLARAARAAGVKEIIGFGENSEAQARVLSAELAAEDSKVNASILGEEITYRLGVPGRHVVQNSLGVLACVKLAGGDLDRAARALAAMMPPKGRGQRFVLKLNGGKALLLDESYNANPASMRAAIEVLGRAPVGAGGRRIAVLGEMLELGAKAETLHAGLAADLAAAKVDKVFCAGPLMRALYDALPPALRGGYAESGDRIEPEVLAVLKPGDAVMIKGSNASRMHAIAATMIRKFSARAAGGAV
jgi:UDP-N-acetylmuramoyl-tripeptide--D-alanyl-D-alanine ligase